MLSGWSKYIEKLSTSAAIGFSQKGRKSIGFPILFSKKYRVGSYRVFIFCWNYIGFFYRVKYWVLAQKGQPDKKKKTYGDCESRTEGGPIVFTYV